jgi:hypothetical protein
MEPPVNRWEEEVKPRLIEAKIYEICSEICRKGSGGYFRKEFECLYNYIEDNLEEYLPEPDIY